MFQACAIQPRIAVQHYIIGATVHSLRRPECVSLWVGCEPRYTSASHAKSSCHLQDNVGRFRELHEAHIARMAAVNKLAEVQARLASTSTAASQQASAHTSHPCPAARRASCEHVRMSQLAISCSAIPACREHRLQVDMASGGQSCQPRRGTSSRELWQEVKAAHV